MYTKIEYDPLELATKIFTPSYVSLETVLTREGVIFQPYETIFVISYLSRKIEVDTHPIQYRRMKGSLLLEPKGIMFNQNYAVATKERAFLDALYLYGEYFVDNPGVLDNERVWSLLELYNSKALSQRVRRYLKMLDIGQHRFVLVQILKDIYSNSEINTQLVFKGGTACYLFYRLPRFSVDLDFSLLNEDKKELVFSCAENILSAYGNIKDAKVKRQTLFFLLSYGEQSTNIKVEISMRQFPDRFEVRNYFGIPMLVMNKEHIMAHKLVALLDRSSIANRDLFDLWYFFKNNWNVDREIVEMRTGKTFEDYLKECIKRLKNVNTTYLLQGLGEVLDEKQKLWAKKNLKQDLLFLMQSYM